MASKDEDYKKHVARFWEQYENEIPRWSSLAADVIDTFERNNASWQEIENVCVGLFLQAITSRFGELQADVLREAISQLVFHLNDDELAKELSKKTRGRAMSN